MHVAHFVQRYPPAIGGSEAYFARLTEYLRACGGSVDVWTTTAIELSDFSINHLSRLRGRGRLALQPGEGAFHEPEASARERQLEPVAYAFGSSNLKPENHPPPPRSAATSPAKPGEVESNVRQYAPLTFPLRRYVLKAISLLPYPPLQCLSLPCSPICPQMWRDAGRYDGPLDAVHATAFPYSFPIACALRLARRRRVPFFLTPFLHLGNLADPHDRTRHQYTQPALRYLLRQADHIFVQTVGERDAVVSLGVPDSHITLQGLGVEAAEVTGGDREATRQLWGVGDAFVIGHLANASLEKGTVDLLQAIAKLPVRVVLAGPSMPNFERFWATYPHRDRVTRLGPISDAEKRNFFAVIDAFALPSRTDSFGLVLLEAWANTKPVIVYAAGGPGELVRDGVDGYVVPCRVDALAKRLPDLRTASAMGEAGRERVAREFRWADKLGLVRKVMVERILAGR